MCTSFDINSAFTTVIFPIMVRCLRFHWMISFSICGSLFVMLIVVISLLFLLKVIVTADYLFSFGFVALRFPARRQVLTGVVDRFFVGACSGDLRSSLACCFLLLPWLCSVLGAPLRSPRAGPSRDRPAGLCRSAEESHFGCCGRRCTAAQSRA